MSNEQPIAVCNSLCVTMQHVRVSYSTHQEKMLGSFSERSKLHTTKSKAIGKIKHPQFWSI